MTEHDTITAMRRQVGERQRDLYELQAFLSDHPELLGAGVRPYRGGCSWTWYFGKDEVDSFTEAVRALKRGAPKASITKNIGEYTTTVTWKAKNGHAWVAVAIAKEATCTAKVVGTRTVTKLDPAHTIEVVENIVSWDCHPILDGV